MATPVRSWPLNIGLRVLLVCRFVRSWQSRQSRVSWRSKLPQGLAIRTADLIDHQLRRPGQLGRLGPLDHRARHVPVCAGVELEPDRFAARRVHFLNRRGGHGREHLQVPPRSGGARNRDFPVRVKRPLAPDGGARTMGVFQLTPIKRMEVSIRETSINRRDRI